MAEASHHDRVDDIPSREKQKIAKQLSNHSITDGVNEPQGKHDKMSRFRKVLCQLRTAGMASMVSAARQAYDQVVSGTDCVPPHVGCKVVGEPAYGSFNLVYCIEFEDGHKWILKVPSNGHRECFDSLAAQSMESEVRTMQHIKAHTPRVPLPAVYCVDASMDNPIRCPYILMEFLDGIQLYHVWFCPDYSASKQKQVRLRAIQTIAAAMAELSILYWDESGALDFNSEGEVVGIVGAKTYDIHGLHDRWSDPNNKCEDDPYCVKGPFTDHLSYILSMLDRRGTKPDDSVLDRGRHASLRLMAEWAFRHSEENALLESDDFGLAHPDLDTQNILVDNDGTLRGIIDWDGTCVVPKSIGALKYPLWLMRDWNPAYKHDPTRPEDEAKELEDYRLIYAQCVENALLRYQDGESLSRQGGFLTRASLLMASLELAANHPKFTNKIVCRIFDEMHIDSRIGRSEKPVGVTEEKQSAGSHSTSSGASSSYNLQMDSDDSDVSDGGDESDDGESSGEEFDDSSDSEIEDGISEQEQNFEEDQSCPNPQCNANHTKTSNDSAQREGDEVIEPFLHQEPSSFRNQAEPTASQGPSRKVKFGHLLCNFAEKGCRGLASTLYHKEAPEALRNEHRGVEVLPTPEATPAPCSASKFDEEEGTSFGAPSQSIPASPNDTGLQHHKSEPGEDSHSQLEKETNKENRVDLILEWMIRTLRTLVRKMFSKHKQGIGLAEDLKVQLVTSMHTPGAPELDAQQPQAVQVQSIQEFKATVKNSFSTEAESLGNDAKKSKRTTTHDLVQVREDKPEVDLAEILDRIIRELKNCGVSTSLIKSHQVKIVHASIARFHSKQCPKAHMSISTYDVAEAGGDNFEINYTQALSPIIQAVIESGESATMIKAHQTIIFETIIAIAEKDKKRLRKQEEKKAMKAQLALEAEKGDPGDAGGSENEYERLDDKAQGMIATNITNTIQTSSLHQAASPLTHLVPAKQPQEDSALVAAIADAETMKEKAAGKPVAHSLTADGVLQPTSLATTNSALATGKSNQIEGKKDHLLSAEQPVVKVVPSLADQKPGEPEAAGKPVADMLSHTTTSSKAIPKNKPCPCGSKHKFKKCCGKVQVLAVALKPSAEPEHQDKILESSKQDSSSAGRGSSPAGQTSSKTSVASVENGTILVPDAQRIKRSNYEAQGRASATFDDAEKGNTGLITVSDNSHQEGDVSGGVNEACETAHEVDDDRSTSESETQKKGDARYHDSGTLTMENIYIALANGNLDEEREEALREKFVSMLDEMTGVS